MKHTHAVERRFARRTLAIRDFAFRCWKGDENSDEAHVLSGD